MDALARDINQTQELLTRKQGILGLLLQSQTQNPIPSFEKVVRQLSVEINELTRHLEEQTAALGVWLEAAGHSLRAGPVDPPVPVRVTAIELIKPVGLSNAIPCASVGETPPPAEDPSKLTPAELSARFDPPPKLSASTRVGTPLSSDLSASGMERSVSGGCRAEKRRAPWLKALALTRPQERAENASDADELRGAVRAWLAMKPGDPRPEDWSRARLELRPEYLCWRGIQNIPRPVIDGLDSELTGLGYKVCHTEFEFTIYDPQLLRLA